MPHGVHWARVLDEPDAVTGKYAWSDAQCGDWSGYRYKTVEAAERGAERHNETAAERDRRVERRLFGPRHAR